MCPVRVQVTIASITPKLGRMELLVWTAGNDGEHAGDDTVTALVTPSFPSHMVSAVGTPRGTRLQGGVGVRCPGGSDG